MDPAWVSKAGQTGPKEDICINFKIPPYLLYLDIFSLKINIEMCKSNIVFIIFFLKDWSYSAEFEMVLKLKCYNSTGRSSALVFWLNKIRRVSHYTSTLYILIFKHFNIFSYAFEAEIFIANKTLTQIKFYQKLI